MVLEGVGGWEMMAEVLEEVPSREILEGDQQMMKGEEEEEDISLGRPCQKQLYEALHM